MKKSFFWLVLLLSTNLIAQSDKGVNSGIWSDISGSYGEWGPYAEAWNNEGDNDPQSAVISGKTKYLVVHGDIYVQQWLKYNVTEGHDIEGTTHTVWSDINTHEYGEPTPKTIDNNGAAMTYSDIESIQIMSDVTETVIVTYSSVAAYAKSNSFNPDPRAYMKAFVIYYWY